MDFEKPSWLKGRQKGCVTPAVAPVAFDPTATYDKYDLIKLGDYLEITLPSSADYGDRKMWLYTVYGVTSTMLKLYANFFTSDLLRAYAIYGGNTTYFELRFATTTGSKNHAHTIGVYSVFSGASLFGAGNAAWYANPPAQANLSGWTSDNFSISAGSKIYRCKQKIVGTAERITIFPNNTDYWEALAGYAPEATSTPRSFCTAINPYEAVTCGRCGNPLDPA